MDLAQRAEAIRHELEHERRDGRVEAGVLQPEVVGERHAQLETLALPGVEKAIGLAQRPSRSSPAMRRSP